MVGVGGAAAAGAAASLVADYFPGQRRALAMGIYMSGISLGGVMGILAGGSLQGMYGWRVAMMAVGFPGFVLALLAWRLDDPGRPPLSLTLREVLHELEFGVRGLAPILIGTATGCVMAWFLNRRYGPDSKLDTAALAVACAVGFAVNIMLWVRRARRAPAPGSELPPDVMTTALGEIERAFLVVLRTPTLVYIFVGGAMISFGMGGLVGWAPTLLSRTLGLTVQQVTTRLGAAGLVSGILGALVGGWLADVLRRRWASSRVVIAGLGFVIGAPLAFWLLTIRDLSFFVPVFSAAFFFLTWYSGPLTAAIFDVAPARLSTTVVGAYFLFIHLAGDAVSFPLIGMLSDRFGLDRAVYLLPAMSLAGGLVVLASSRTIARDITQVSRATGEWKVVGGGKVEGREV
jgi:predicted MFS family arabinose efflux permease